MEIENPEATVSAQGGQRRGWTWVRWLGLSSIGAFAILLAALAQPGLTRRAEPFFTVPAGDTALDPSIKNRMPLLFRLLGVDNGVFKHALELESSEDILSSPKIGLLLISNWKSGKVVSASMGFSDSETGVMTAEYDAKKGSTIRENRKLEFVRKSGAQAQGASRPQKVSITIYSTVGPDLAVVGQFSEGEPLSKMLWVATTSPQGKSGVASAWGWRERSEPGESLSRACLLAQTWGLSDGGDRIVYSLILLASGVWLLGTLAVTQKSSSTRRGGVFLAVGSTLLFFSVGAVFSLLFPPFHAPDEPDHFLTYALLASRQGQVEDALRLANAGHFERIKFRPDEKFSAMDVGHPEQASWAPHVASTNTDRSPMGMIVWSLAGKFFQGNNAGMVLFGLRLMNVFFVAVCLGGSIVLAAYAMSPGRASMLLVAPVILTPAVAFFSMAVSNYPFLIGGYIVQAMALGILWALSPEAWNRRRPQVVAAAMAGAGLVLAIAAADNGIFSIPFWAILIPSYWFLRGVRSTCLRDEFRIWRSFFIAYFLSMATLWTLVGMLAGTFFLLPPVLTSFFDQLLNSRLNSQTIIILAYSIPLVLLSAALLLLGRSSRREAFLSRTKAWLVAPLMLGFLFIIFAKSSRMPDFAATSFLGYALHLIYSFFEGLGPGESDWLVTQSFWGVFGWLDTPMPTLLNDTIRYAVGIGLVSLFVCTLNKDRLPSGIGFFAANIFAMFWFLAFTAAGYYFMKYGISGRYLIGAYLLIMTVAAEGYRRIVAAKLPDTLMSENLRGTVCLLAIFLQSVAWLSIVNRYF